MTLITILVSPYYRIGRFFLWGDPSELGKYAESKEGAELIGYLRESKTMMFIIATVSIGTLMLSKWRFRTLTRVVPKALIAGGDVNPSDVLVIERDPPEDFPDILP